MGQMVKLKDGRIESIYCPGDMIYIVGENLGSEAQEALECYIHGLLEELMHKLSEAMNELEKHKETERRYGDMPKPFNDRDYDYLDHLAEEDEDKARMEYLERMTDGAYQEYRDNLNWEGDE